MKRSLSICSFLIVGFQALAFSQQVPPLVAEQGLCRHGSGEREDRDHGRPKHCSQHAGPHCRGDGHQGEENHGCRD